MTRIHSVAGLGERPARDGAAVPRAAPHDLGAGARRRRAATDAGRDHARAPRRAVPRRAARVRADGARGAAPAARGRPRRRSCAASARSTSRPRDARRRVQPAARAARPTGPMLVHRCRARALRGDAQRPAARPHRHRLPGRAGRPRSSSCGPRGSGRRPRVDAQRVWRRRGRASGAGSPGTGALCNGDMDGAADAPRACRSTAALTGRWSRRATQLDLSARGHDRVLRVARTLADLDGRDRLAARRRRRGARLPRCDSLRPAGRMSRLRRLPAPGRC